ncbi:MAG: deoxyribonuclease IV [Planctomycetota bacterium]|jgi:deoxyribonuclease-4
MFGSHLSIAGGMVNALVEAERLKLDCVQVFTKNQRQWKVRPLDAGERDAWLSKLAEMGWHRRRGPVRVVSHNSYLINMASPDPTAWERSVELQRIEIERCEELRIPLCVAHPGAHLGDAPRPGTPHDLDAPPTRDERAGMKRIVKALDHIHRALPGYRTITCLETTVGSGTNLGYCFEQLAWIREHVREPERVAFCFDTCHVTAAGYDMSTDRGAEAVLRRFASVCGRGSIRVMHLNDSVGEVGSRRDRHAHIGDGTCGRACFRTIVNRRALASVPKVLETPKGDDDAGVPWDLVNVRRLKRLISRRGRSR